MHSPEKKDINPEISPANPGRRRFLKITGITLLTSPLIAACGGIPTPEAKGLKTEPLYSGEIEQTKSLLDTWETVLKTHPDLEAQFEEESIKLAIAFYNKQYGYAPNRFTEQVFLLDKDAFKAQNSACGVAENIDGIAKQDKIYIKRVSKTPDSIFSTFALTLHELGHLDPPTVKYPKPKGDSNGFIDHEKGLATFIINKYSPNPNLCFAQEYTNLEEAVNHDQVTRLIALLGFTSYLPGYTERVQKYRTFVLDFLYDGDHRELLSYQKQTNNLAFFRSVGERLMKKDGTFVDDIEVQIDKGIDYINTLF